MFKALDAFHKSRLGYLTFGLLELGLAYAIASLAVDNGSLWLWLLTLILVIGCLQNFFHLFTKLFSTKAERGRRSGSE